MRNIWKKIIAVMLAVGFCITSIPSAAIAFENIVPDEVANTPESLQEYDGEEDLYDPDSPDAGSSTDALAADVLEPPAESPEFTEQTIIEEPLVAADPGAISEAESVNLTPANVGLVSASENAIAAEAIMNSGTEGIPETPDTQAAQDIQYTSESTTPEPLGSGNSEEANQHDSLPYDGDDASIGSGNSAEANQNDSLPYNSDASNENVRTEQTAEDSPMEGENNVNAVNDDVPDEQEASSSDPITSDENTVPTSDNTAGTDTTATTETSGTTEISETPDNTNPENANPENINSDNTNPENTSPDSTIPEGYEDENQEEVYQGESPSDDEIMNEIDQTTGEGSQEGENIESTESTENTGIVYSYEDSDVHVTATLDEADRLPEGAEFFMVQLYPESEDEEERAAYSWAEGLLNQFLSENELFAVKLIYYDLYFEVDGSRITVDKPVHINIEYKNHKEVDPNAGGFNMWFFRMDDTLDPEETKLGAIPALLEMDELGAMIQAEYDVEQYRYTPLIISMLENREEHEARLAGEEAAGLGMEDGLYTDGEAVGDEAGPGMEDDLYTDGETVGDEAGAAEDVDVVADSDENAEEASSEKKIIFMEEPEDGEDTTGANTDLDAAADDTTDNEDVTDQTDQEEGQEEGQEETKKFITDQDDQTEAEEETDKTEAEGNEKEDEKEDKKEDEKEDEKKDEMADDAEDAAPQTRTYYASLNGDVSATVILTDPAQVPDSAEIVVTAVTPDAVDYNYDAYIEALNNNPDSNITYTPENTLLYDISFVDHVYDEEGELIDTVTYEPAEGTVKVQLRFNSNQLSNEIKAENSEDVTVNHLVTDAEADPTAISAEEIAVDPVDANVNLSGIDSVSFSTESFSVYAFTYTVDFHYEINGQTVEFSIPGGGFVSLEHIVEVLGIARNEENDDNNRTEQTSVEEHDANTGTYEESINLNNLDVSEETETFVADVESVVFSSPELVWVGKVDSDNSVGGLKEANGLEIEYSADLTEEQIDEINAQTVKAGDWALISVLPFTSEESLTVTMTNGDQFLVRVTDAQIKKTMIDAKGNTWEITVTYGDDAQIPETAELKVREILPEDEAYDAYYRQSLEKVGVVTIPGTGNDTEYSTDINVESTDENIVNNPETGSDNYAHIFDIQIWDADHEIQPESDVTVNIKLLDAPESGDVDLQVVHFGKDGLEVMELTGADEVLEEKAGSTELEFVTDEFSVYTVINAANTNLNGQSFALVSGIANDPGATTGYGETWGRDYFTIIVNAHAVSNTINGDGISSTGVHTWTENGISYAGGEVPEWTFESADNSTYYLSVIDENGNKKYLTRTGQYAWGCQLSDYKNDFSRFRIQDNGDGTVLIYYEGNGNDQKYYLYNDGNGEWATRTFKFRNKEVNTSSSAFRFKLCKKSDDFDSFAAHKVAASEITTNTNYVIYRKFNDAQGNEALYALAHDGTFVRVYDGGDTIYWRETDKNIYWNYQMDGSSPVLFTQNPITHETVYINPNHSTGQTLSSTAAGLTLLGKDNGEYSTAIECWDQTAYDYAGLHVTVDNDYEAALSTGTRVADTSDDFLFAVASTYPGATAETVDTVDSNSLGIKITMFDYGSATTEYKAGDKLDSMTNVAGSDEYTPHAAHALVKAYLESGLPSSTAKGAMTGLFTANGSAVTAYKENVNHLFLQSYYDESGTFRYRSEDNYAYLPFNPQTATITGTDFIVYRQAATPYTSNIQVGHTYYHHGHFMPFNDIDMNNNLSRLMNQYGNDYQNGEIIGEIPLGDGRTYEDIYGTQGIPNFYTGMKMEAKFTQPRGGRLENGDDMIFKFTGDDDMWVYIDDVLVLDIGGIHEPLSGTINFATGVVTNPVGSSLAGTTTLYQIFQNVLNAPSTPQSVKEKINAITWKDVDGNGTLDTFADYTNHDFKAFYMERGAGASNLDIQFNLKVVLTNQFTVQKEIPEDVDDRFDNQVYKFQATYMDGNTEKALHAGISNVCSAVVYKDKKDAQGNPVDVPVDNDGYFTLRAGEAAVFMMEDESIRYNVKEVDLNQYNLEKVTINGNEVTEHVEINDQQATITDNAAVTGYDEVVDRSNVLYRNYPKTQNLLITKHLTDDSALLAEGENPVFEFRVYLETTIVNGDGNTSKQLVPYSYGPYYLVKEVDGVRHYFTLTGVNNAPVDRGTDPVVCSTTGRSGSINSIPPEYTIIIPNLVVGTNFYVEERRDNIPEGYEFVREELKEGTYDESTLIHTGDSADIISRVLARDETDLQAFDPNTVGQIKSDVDAESHVYNRKPAVIITVEKEWDPVPEDEDAYVTVELRRYAKITKGTISVTLYDNNDAPIEGAVFELYKDGAATGIEVTTNVNGIASVSGLEAGTYKLVQKSTPAGYSMDGNTTETDTLTVADEVATPQTLSERLTNTALVTAGKVTLTLTDSGAGSGTSGAPIAGAAFTLYKDDVVYNTGYTTDDEGKVVVGNLDAGVYYFVQTGTSAEYNLPNVTRTENFTVEDQPGVSQTFTQSMTNSLKGKGTISLTLKKESGEAISGASFQLKSGSTVLETATTGSEGTLSFNTEMYEGSYTVHQVDTGNAGADYAVAADQTVTIQTNSMTNQHQSLTFENEEATGNVTISLWKGDYSQYNQKEVTPSITGLQAGVEYTFRIGGMPSNNVNNNDTIGYTTSFVPGQAPSNVIGIPKSYWTQDESTYYYDIKFTPQQDDKTYIFGIVSQWGLKDTGITFTLLENDRIMGVNSVLAVPKRSVRSSFGTTNESIARSIAHTNASPASAPSGYAEDSTFVAIEATLNADGNWKHTFDIQDKYDADGNPYYYYVVETDCSDKDYWIDSYTGDSLNDAGTITVKNAKEKTGSIQVTKSFSGVTALPDGFQITNDYNSEVFTVANASSGSGKSDDPYVWTLSEIPAGTTVSFTESGATVNGYDLTVTSGGTVIADSTVAATAAAGETVTAGLVNTYEMKTTEITLKKVDKNNLNESNPNLLKGAAFTLTKYQSDSYQNEDTSWGTKGSKSLSDDKNPDGTYTLNGVFTFDGLTAGYYKIEEINFPAGYIKLSGDPTFKVEANANNELFITLINNPGDLLKLVDGELTILVGNTPGVVLPNTGGSGTTLLYLLGSALILLGGTFLGIRGYKRRKESRN